MRRFLVLLMCLMALAVGAQAQIEVLLDEVEGEWMPGYVMADTDLKFILRCVNYSGHDMMVATNSFVVSSPDGALWEPIIFDTLNIGWPGMFDMVLQWEYFSANGSGADSVGFAAVAYPPNTNGFPDGFNERTFWIATRVSSDYVGNYLCLDSASIQVAYPWEWGYMGKDMVVPDWSGPHCFEVVPRNEPPVIDPVPDHLLGYVGQAMVYDFDAYDPENDDILFELIDGPGSIDEISGEWTYVPQIGDVGVDLYITVRACDPYTCGGSVDVPVIVENLYLYDGLSFHQISYDFDSVQVDYSMSGQLEVDVPTFLASTYVDSGYLNVVSDMGWIVQNFPIWDDSETVRTMVDFQITDAEGTPIDELEVSLLFTEDPLVDVDSVDMFPAYYVVDEIVSGVEGAGGLFTTVVPLPFAPNTIMFDPLGIVEYESQPNASNVQTAKDQCFPMSIANSLQYLEDRYGLPVPHEHKKGLKGDNSLVGQLGQAANRFAPARDSGYGVWFRPMVEGKFKYCKGNGLRRKLICKHQGYGYGRATHNEALPAGDFSANGMKSEDESVNGKVTWDWICDQIKNGEDVEVVFSYDDAAGNAVGGHAVRITGCGKILGIPFLSYVHDGRQTHQGDPADTLGLETGFAWATDSDGDGIVNFHRPNQEIRFAFSESADNDYDGVPDGLDNSPHWYNPAQIDADGDDIGDVEQLPWLETNEIPGVELFAGDAYVSDYYPNDVSFPPLFKDIWFKGWAWNPNEDTARVVVSFLIDGIMYMPKDTTFVPPYYESEVFGAYSLDYCPMDVAVYLESPDYLISVGGELYHLCYPDYGCCTGESVGNMDCEPGIVDMGDLTILIDHLFISLEPLCCVEEGDVDLSGQPEPEPSDVDMSDLTILIDHLFISLDPLPPCP